jgi:hypothetical protein
MSLPATENYSAATADLPDPPWATWKGNPGGFKIKTDGSGRGTPNTNNQDCLDRWDNDTFNNDQYSQVVARFTGPGNGTQYLYLIARATGATSTPSTAFTYWFWSDGGSDTSIIKHPGSASEVVLATANATTFASGDLLRFEVSGSTLTGFKNGGSVITATDSSITTGAAGMGGFGSIGTVLIDDWEGGNLGGAGLPPGLGPEVGLAEPVMQAAQAAMMR